MKNNTIKILLILSILFISSILSGFDNLFSEKEIIILPEYKEIKSVSKKLDKLLNTTLKNLELVEKSIHKKEKTPVKIKRSREKVITCYENGLKYFANEWYEAALIEFKKGYRFAENPVIKKQLETYIKDTQKELKLSRK